MKFTNVQRNEVTFLEVLQISELQALKSADSKLLSRSKGGEVAEALWIFDGPKIVGIQLSLKTLSDTTATTKVTLFNFRKKTNTC